MEFRSETILDAEQGQPFEFQISNWWSEDLENEFVIRVFGTTKEGRSVHMRVQGFTPYFFVEIPEYWKVSDIQFLKNWFRCEFGSDFVGGVVVEKMRFFGFANNKKFRFLKVIFSTHQTMRRAGWALKRPLNIPTITKRKIWLAPYESKLEPVLRFMHLREIEGSGWVRVNKFVENDEAKTQYSIEADWDKVDGIQKEIQAPRLIMSFDIETDSKDGTFPQYHRPEDKIIQIGNTVHWYNHPDHPEEASDRAKIVDQTIFVYPNCDPIPGVNVVNCRTEAELIVKWAEYVEKLDPDELTGYYIVGFDFEYIFRRAEMLGVLYALENVHRIYDREAKYDERKMSSSAYGDNTYKMIEMVGRNRIDLCKYIAREYKLSSYKLDNVSKHFLGSKKNDLKYSKLFEMQHGSPADRAVIADYCIQDCRLCNHLMHKLDVLGATVGMSNVTMVPLEYLFVRGQGVKVFSQVAQQATKKGYLIKTLYPKESGRSYLGALVIDPEIGFFQEPITVMDFNSLYPNIMISENISPDTKVTDSKYLGLPTHNYNIINHTTTEGEEKVIIFAERKDGKKGILPDILVTLLNARKETRAEIKRTSDPFRKKTLNYRQLSYKVSANSIYGALGSATNAISDPECAASVTAQGRWHLDNARNIVLDNFEGSDCVYGDTDSIFVRFDYPKEMPEREKIKQSIVDGTVAAKMVTDNIKHPMKLAYEKVLNRLILITKKRYVGNLYEEDPDSYVRKSMGLVTKRRDNAPLTKKFYNGILDILMDGERDKIEGNLTIFFNQFMRKLLDRQFPIEDLVLSKTLGGSYKDPSRITQARLAERMRERDPGSAPNVNDRVQYVFVVKGTPKKQKKMLQGDRVEPPDYVKEHNLPIDIMAYVQHVKKPITQLLSMVLDDPDRLFKPYEQEEENKMNGIFQLRPFDQPSAYLRAKKKKLSPKTTKALSKQTTLRWIQSAAC
jgi:DNA polymerase delta subunit 1